MFATSSSSSESLHRNPAPLQTSACQHQHSRLQPRKKGPGRRKARRFSPKTGRPAQSLALRGWRLLGFPRNGCPLGFGSSVPKLDRLGLPPDSDMRLRQAGQANFRPALRAETTAPTQRRRRAARSQTLGTARACGPTCKTTARRNLPQPYCVHTGSNQSMCHT